MLPVRANEINADFREARGAGIRDPVVSSTRIGPTRRSVIMRLDNSTGHTFIWTS